MGIVQPGGWRLVLEGEVQRVGGGVGAGIFRLGEWGVGSVGLIGVGDGERLFWDMVRVSSMGEV